MHFASPIFCKNVHVSSTERCLASFNVAGTADGRFALETWAPEGTPLFAFVTPFLLPRFVLLFHHRYSAAMIAPPAIKVLIMMGEQVIAITNVLFVVLVVVVVEGLAVVEVVVVVLKLQVLSISVISK